MWPWLGNPVGSPVDIQLKARPRLPQILSVTNSSIVRGRTHSAMTRRRYFIVPSLPSDSCILFPPVLLQCSLSHREHSMYARFQAKYSSLILSTLNNQEFLHSLKFAKQRLLKVAFVCGYKCKYVCSLRSFQWTQWQ